MSAVEPVPSSLTLAERRTVALMAAIIYAAAEWVPGPSTPKTPEGAARAAFKIWEAVEAERARRQEAKLRARAEARYEPEAES